MKRLPHLRLPIGKPRSGKRVEPPSGGAIAYVAIMLLVLWLWQDVAVNLTLRTLPYSDFKRHVARHEVVEATIRQDEIIGRVALGPTNDVAPAPSAGVAGKGPGEQPREFLFRTVRIDDPDLVRELQAARVRFAAVHPGFLSQALLSWVLPIAVMAGIWTFVGRRMAGQSLFSFWGGRAQLVVDSNTGVTFSDVAGCDEAKLELAEVVDFLKAPRRYQELGARIPEGVLLRPGRFDRQVVVDAPDLSGREAILQVHSREKRLASDVDLRRIAAATAGFAGADLANVLNEAALGYTLQLPAEDQFLSTQSELLARIRTLLGGRAAEDIVFREVSTGAQSDLERATALARQMVVWYGMSGRIGLAHCAHRPATFLGGADAAIQRDCSEQTAWEIDAEVKRILSVAYREAKRCLLRHRDQLDRIAAELLACETLDGATFYQMLGHVSPQSCADEPGGREEPAAHEMESGWELAAAPR